MPTAVLIDGGFFLKRFARCFPLKDPFAPIAVARTAFETALAHLDDKDEPAGRRKLYRISFYDCPPLQKRVHQPISKKSLDFAISPSATFRLELHDELRQTRKVALRLGHISAVSDWELKPDRLKALLNGEIVVSALTDDDSSTPSVKRESI